MKNKKHKPPSRERYEKKYPVWSVRMPQEWIEDAELLLKDTEQSRRDFMGIALRKQKADYTDADENGFEEGKSFGIRKWRIWYYCIKCRVIIYMKPNRSDHKALIEYMKKYRWEHDNCPSK